MNSPTNHQHPQFSAPLIPISLQREDYSQPWGFRIQGGADYRLYLSVKKVTLDSPAFNHLHVGDVIIGINNHDATRMTHQQSHDLIANSGLNLTLMVRKGQYQVIKATQKPVKYTQIGSANPSIIPVQNAYKRF